MNNTASLLPEGFEALEPFVEAWAINGTANRAARRITSDCVEKKQFYNAGKELLAPGLAFLDRKPLDQFNDKENRLMNLLLSLAHISLAVEIQEEDEIKHAQYASRMRFTRTIADT